MSSAISLEDLACNRLEDMKFPSIDFSKEELKPVHSPVKDSMIPGLPVSVPKDISPSCSECSKPQVVWHAFPVRVAGNCTDCKCRSKSVVVSHEQCLLEVSPIQQGVVAKPEQKLSQDLVPFHKVGYEGNEMKYLMESFTSGSISGDGKFARASQDLLQKTLGVPKVLLTTSCTDALEMCALLLNIQPGDEVIVPSYTYVSSINAFVLYGAKPVFVDVRMDNMNIDEEQLDAAITDKTKAIVVVHYAGFACNMEEIMRLAKKYNVPVVEDAAHALFARYKGKCLGSFGCLGTLSFHATKNITCGEGGALLINDMEMYGRAQVLLNKGTDRAAFLAGLVDKYTWVDLGSSYLISDLLAALLLAQLENRNLVYKRRKQVWHGYYEGLKSWADKLGVILPPNPDNWEPGFTHSYHIFHMVMPSQEMRMKFAAHMSSKAVKTSTHYQPLHLAPMGVRFGGYAGMCEVSEQAGARLIRLPMFLEMNQEMIDKVVVAATSFDGN